MSSPSTKPSSRSARTSCVATVLGSDAQGGRSQIFHDMAGAAPDGDGGLDDEITRRGDHGDEPAEQFDRLGVRMQSIFAGQRLGMPWSRHVNFGEHRTLLQHLQIIAPAPRAVALAEAQAVPGDEIDTLERRRCAGALRTARKCRPTAKESRLASIRGLLRGSSDRYTDSTSPAAALGSSAAHPHCRIQAVRVCRGAADRRTPAASSAPATSPGARLLGAAAERRRREASS